MKKIAIVGVEGSGKTVMMAAMSDQWERPDEHGYFLSPENAEAFGFSKSVMSILRSGRWPSASSHDEMRTLEWSLQRRRGGSVEKVADIAMLDYAGEVYRQAFGGEKREGYDEHVATLRSHVDEADVLIVLVNLSDIINGSMANRRTRDAIWLTKSVLDYALGKARNDKPQTAIVFSQADGYQQIIAANGGPAGTLQQYLPHVANLYDNLPMFVISAISHTIVGDDGLPVPASEFHSMGMKELMDWMIQSCSVTVHHNEAVDEVLVEDRRSQFFTLFGQRRYSEAIAVWCGMLDECKNDPEILIRLAFMFRFGKGTVKDVDQAMTICVPLYREHYEKRLEIMGLFKTNYLLSLISVILVFIAGGGLSSCICATLEGVLKIYGISSKDRGIILPLLLILGLILTSITCYKLWSRFDKTRTKFLKKVSEFSKVV